MPTSSKAEPSRSARRPKRRKRDVKAPYGASGVARATTNRRGAEASADRCGPAHRPSGSTLSDADATVDAVKKKLGNTQ